MSTWLAWLAIFAGVVLLLVVGVLLFLVLAKERTRRPQQNPTGRGFVPTTPDETMVISRQQADEILNK